MTVTQSAERRRHQRKIKPFYVAFSGDGVTYIPAYGVDISEGGIGILSPLHTPDGEFNLRLLLEGRDFVVTVRGRRTAEQLREGKVWYAIGVEFVSVEEADRRFINDVVLGLQIPEANAVLANLEATFDRPAQVHEIVENKRNAKRKQKAFYIAFSVNDLVYIPAYGLDISRDGMRIFTDVEMPDVPFKVRVMLEGREFTATLKKCWGKQVPHGSKTGWITGTRFTEIAPIEREFIDCYANGEPFYAGNKLLEALERLRLEPDRADLWLPPELLTAFLQQLVALNRLAPLSEKTYPLVRYRYEGTTISGEEVTHIVLIESRKLSSDGLSRFNTRFGFDQTGANLRVL